jgi:hypothetical protein
MCLLSCEEADIAGDPDAEDGNDFCQQNASWDFICRSSGGGSENRKVCMPATCGIGAACSSDDDCGDLSCVRGATGGYCSKRDCAVNDDCPGDSLCVTSGGSSYCYKACSAASDCSLCRFDGVRPACSDDVVFAEDGTTGSVCIPPA